VSESHGALHHSVLDAEHRRLGARMAPFGGWEMPIQYTGVLEEHRACREHAVVFDVSHLGSVRVHGAGAFAAARLASRLSRVSSSLGGAAATRIAPRQPATHAD